MAASRPFAIRTRPIRGTLWGDRRHRGVPVVVLLRPRRPWQDGEGSDETQAIIPHGMAKLSYPGQGEEAIRQAQERGDVHVGGLTGNVSGACFDEKQRLLYVCKLRSIRVGLELHPCIHVYRVK
jgi:hypothetical protein